MQVTYEQFKAEWEAIGKVDYDKAEKFQCVDLILQFLSECAGVSSGVWGNAIDYAINPTPAFLNATVKVTDGSQRPGDILVFVGVDAQHLDGHIALRDTDLTKMLEQNALGDGSGLGENAIGVYRTIPTSRLVAVYRLKVFTGGSQGGDMAQVSASDIGKTIYHVVFNREPESVDAATQLGQRFLKDPIGTLEGEKSSAEFIANWDMIAEYPLLQQQLAAVKTASPDAAKQLEADVQAAIGKYQQATS